MDIIYENYLFIINEDKTINSLYHSSEDKITKPINQPTWFAIKKKHAIDGWYKNIEAEHGMAYLHLVKPKGKIAYEDDNSIKTLFTNNNINILDYTTSLMENPSSKEVLNMKGTKILQKNNYIGLYYLDYDPRDFSKDLPAVIIFNPLKHASSFKVVKT